MVKAKTNIRCLAPRYWMLFRMVLNSYNASCDSVSVLQKEEDPFGCDPFAILHAPPRPGTTSNIPSPSVARSESPSPALPPKKCKQPPPRPAPPRPAPPAVPSGFDADFADFSGFSHKVSVRFVAVCCY